MKLPYHVKVLFVLFCHQVYDRDLTSSDFMGSAFVALTELELNR